MRRKSPKLSLASARPTGTRLRNPASKFLVAMMPGYAATFAIAGPLSGSPEPMLAIAFWMIGWFMLPFILSAIFLRLLRVGVLQSFLLVAALMFGAVALLTDVGPTDLIITILVRGVVSFAVLIPLFSLSWWVAGLIQRMITKLRGY
jgi:hypothetical protein